MNLPKHGAKAARTPLLRQKNFSRFVLARMLMAFAMQMQSVAIGWHVYALTDSALSLGLVGLFQFLPMVLLVLVTGHAADRFDRRRVAAWSLLCQALASLALLVAAADLRAGVWPIYILVVVLGAARAFSAPALSALLPNIVTSAEFPRAVAFSSSANQFAMLAGPAAGGILLASGVGLPLGLSAVFCFIAAILSVRLTAASGMIEAVGGTDQNRLFGGFAYLRSNPLLLGAISLDLFAVLLGSVTALLPIFARDILFVGPAGFGLLRSGPAIGALAVGLVLAHVPLRRRIGAKMLWCIAGYGAATFLFSVSTSFLLSVFAMIALGAFDMVGMVIRQTLVQVATPNTMRGRVSAVNFLFIGASNQLGDFKAGVSAAFLGAVEAAALGGLGAILVVGLWTWLFPQLRRADTLGSEYEPSRKESEIPSTTREYLPESTIGSHSTSLDHKAVS
jgi:MFS family permease